MDEKINIRAKFAKYVSLNICGMVGMSLYILADTFFIAQAVGADGITALNLVLPLYSLIFAIGQMIGVGSAIRFSVEKAQKKKQPYAWFSNALLWTGILGVLFSVAGIFFAERIVALLGGDAAIVAVGAPYTRIFMCFSPFFMWNYVCNAFVRNDGRPTVAMCATLLSSLFNIVFDYILMYPCGLGMAGAALATACSPVVGIGICLSHLLSKRCTLRFAWTRPDFSRLVRACQVGVSAFVGEISSGVTTAVFNFLILGLAGNTGVAAYGVVANLSIVAVAMFNGIAQGTQPLISEFYGRGQHTSIHGVIRMGMGLSLAFALLIAAVTWGCTAPIISVFNKSGDPVLASYAMEGLRLYMLGFFFAGWNIIGSSIFSSMEQARAAFLTSVLRGFVMIILCALALAALLGMTGVWLAFPAAEALTLVVTLYCMRKMMTYKKQD